MALILALDLAMSTGVALGPPNGTPRAWTVKMKGADRDDKYAFWMNEIDRIVHKYRPLHIAYEAQYIGKPNAAEWLFGLAGVTRAVAANWRYAYPRMTIQAVGINTARKHFTGNGGLQRKEAKKAVQDRCDALGWKYKNDDESDALGIWDFRASQLSEAHNLANLRINDGNRQREQGHT